MTVQEFEKKMEVFEKELHSEYGPIHDSCNASYYVFQTNYRYRPDIMIVGLNPGGDFTGEHNLVNPVVRKGRSQNIYIDMRDKELWFNRICNIFGYPNNEYLKDKFETVVGTNIIYSNTGNAEKLERIQDKNAIIQIGRKYTKRLVDEIIHPKAIVTLSNDAFNSLNNISRKELKLYRIKDSEPFHLTIGGRMFDEQKIPILKVPNPSGINNKCFKDDLTERWMKAIEITLKEELKDDKLKVE